jgi:hypothetical protein
MSTTVTAKAKLALRKKDERAHTFALWVRLESLVPNVDENRAQPGCRSKALKGRTKDEILTDVTHALRLAHGQTVPVALDQAYTSQAGAGLIAIELKSGKIVHQSPSFQDLAMWIPVEARGNIRFSMEARDGGDFHSFCQSAVRDAGEPYGAAFLDRDTVVGRTITVRFLTRAPGPPGLRNPEWLLMMRAVKLTLVGVQPRQLAGESTAGGRRLPFFGQARIPEAIGVFTADLSGGMPSQWTVQAAHVRNLLDLEVAPGTYEMEVGNFQPFAAIATFFDLEFSKEEGVGVFSRVASQLEYAATSALNIAQLSAWWLTRKALRVSHQWSMRLNDDDTVTISANIFLTLFGGLSTSVSDSAVVGKVQFSYGGLDVTYFVADPEQPLDSNLRAMCLRITSAKTAGEVGVHRPIVVAFKWGDGIFKIFCKALSFDTVGKIVPSEEGVSQLLEKLKISPGAGLLSDGSASLCVGQSDV